MDWDAEGLLDGLEDAAARAARGRLLDELHADGLGLEELRRIVAEDKLVLAPVSRSLSSEARYTAREVAERAEVPLELLLATWRALGLPLPGEDERLYGDQDVKAARLGAAHRQAGFDDDEALDVARVLGQGMARYAEASRTLVARTFIEPGLDEYELAHRYAAVAEQLMPLAGAVIEPPVRIVKMIGDAVMLVAPEAAPMLRRTLALVDAAAAQEGFPELRAGVASGQAVHRWATGSARRSTWPAGSRRGRGRRPCS